MHRENHLLFNILVLILIYRLFGSLVDLEYFAVFAGSFLFFSWYFTPDIDLKFFFIKHRSITHRGNWTIVFSAMLCFVLLMVFSNFGLEISDPLKPFAVYAILASMGFGIAWFSHIFADIFVPFNMHRTLWKIILVCLITLALFGEIEEISKSQIYDVIAEIRDKVAS